ncbi:M28 family peptidase [candidate division KSB1 bacterium]|nr:M28 family peptidase [candidate division KSB1 bacterium]NIR68678.1 M28 family peptidase [candidate division KSB1 bacterium]NIS27167.1 M28 family peptidase [candidate division KSB1 bacterium]NIT74053.1 M28 family peptidase [candidate division KSB1 bacterium]NIU27919.1 M28 family peptidase [candidate division KSB1 bacterium]
MIKMPGKSHEGPLPPLTEKERSLQGLLRQYVEKLAGDIGERNVVQYQNLSSAADFIDSALRKTGYDIRRQTFEVSGRKCQNIEVELAGQVQKEEIVVIGAHYDSVIDCPGANDNATGVAALLALAQAFADKSIPKTLRFVAFVNEEPPYFTTSSMGSLVYAKSCRERGDNIVTMFSLETIGYYVQQKGSQRYPFPVGLFYPSTGNFIAFVGNLSSRSLVRETVASFRRVAKFPSEGGALPGIIPGVGWSDHWAFWQAGYPALMVTDTAPFRYPFYHTAQDTPDKIHYEQLARVVSGLKLVITDLTGKR